MSTKKCFKCGKIKDMVYFYKHSEMADGHLGKCIACAKKDALAHRKKNLSRVREYDRTRGKLPHRIRANVAHTKKYRKEYPLKYAASLLLNNAVRSGKIKKPQKCSACNAECRIMGHHEDYHKPLDVVWVCQICHKKIHSKYLR